MRRTSIKFFYEIYIFHQVIFFDELYCLRDGFYAVFIINYALVCGDFKITVISKRLIKVKNICWVFAEMKPPFALLYLSIYREYFSYKLLALFAISEFISSFCRTVIIDRFVAITNNLCFSQLFFCYLSCIHISSFISPLPWKPLYSYRLCGRLLCSNCACLPKDL